MPRTARSPLHQLERQSRLTLVLLPLVSGLSWFDSEVIAQTFGQAMSQLNFVEANQFHLPTGLPAVFRRGPRTEEEQRTYWREAQGKRRRRLKIEALERERSEISSRINQLQKLK